MAGERAASAAGGAYVVDTAEVVDPGSCKVESWVSTAANHDFIASVAPACVYDVGRPVEFNTQFSRFRSDGEWGTAILPKLKTNIIPTEIGSWGIAASVTGAYEPGNGGTTALAFTIPATLRLSNTARININAGWQWDRLVDRHYFTYGAATDLRSADNVYIFTAEVFGLTGAAETSSTIRPRFQAGFRYRPVDRLSFDVIYGRNIVGENANWITFATTLRFPPPDLPGRVERGY
ncbi:MAG TPA: hypothetical protein VM867_04245 [Xanthobacteraceae bacterium]|nr:hypothetical protein [Xanthobacteraceae bacterium]